MLVGCFGLLWFHLIVLVVMFGIASFAVMRLLWLVFTLCGSVGCVGLGDGCCLGGCWVVLLCLLCILLVRLFL